MATEKEEVVLQFKVEQGDAITEMERMKKYIIQTKEEQRALNKAYKDGDITITEYAAETVRLEGILKKQQSTYNNVQKSVTGVKTQLDKLIDSNQKISKDLQKTSQSFQDVAGNINIAGTNIGSLTTKLASFANPATAAVGVVSALGAAYARSTIGAKDLEFAQTQLNTAITIGTNAFAGLISSAEDGEGILSRALSAFIFRIDPTTAVLSKIAALNQERLEDLGRSELEIRAKVNERLEENQELLTEIQSEQTTLNQKLANGDLIITNVRRNEEELKDILEEELAVLNAQLGIDEQNEAIQTAILQKKLEISKLERDSEKRVQNIVKLQDNLNDAEAKRLDLLRQQKAVTESGNRDIDIASGLSLEAQSGLANKPKEESLLADGKLGVLDVTKAQASAVKKLGDEIVAVQKSQYAQDLENFLRTQAEKEAAMQAQLTAAQTVSNALAGLSDEGSEIQKAFALTAIAADTARALTGGIAAAQSVPYPGNLVAMASVIASILANVAQAKQIAGFAGGGFTGSGFGSPDSSGFKPAGIVHEHEYVVPKRVTYSPAAQPHIRALESMRLSKYAEGGVVTSAMTAEVDGNRLVMKNAMKDAVKSMPAPVVSAKEITKVQNRVRVKERISKSG